MKKEIEYSDKSWNPYSGCKGIVNKRCGVGKNCWAYKRAWMLGHNPKVKGYTMPDPFKPTFHPDKLEIPLRTRKPTRFNACFMGDIAYCKKNYLLTIIQVMKQCPQHRFYFLTKEPGLLEDMELIWPDNAWVGVTVNCQGDVWRVENLHNIICKHRWISFEPLYGMVTVNLTNIDWIVIGAQTRPELQPEKYWVTNLMSCANHRGIPVFLKPNLTVVEPMMELPEELKVK